MAIPKCPQCGKAVLRIEHRPSTTVFVHEVAGTKENPSIFGCAVSSVKKGDR